jgi:phosphoesterase RecJ-like protein
MTAIPQPENTALAEVASALRSAGRILAMCHIAPDGDAIGSLLGLAWVLRSAGARPPGAIALVCADGVPEQYRYLPGAHQVLTQAPPGPWDAVVTLDASDTRRLGDPYRPEAFGGATVINVDHHVTNLYFGDLNYVDPGAVATSEIIVALADALPAEIASEAAICLLTGIATDTLGFRTSNVTPRVLLTSVRLMQAGADLSDIIARTLTYRPLNDMRLWGLALGDIRQAGGAAWVAVSPEMRARAGAAEGAESGLASFLLGAPEADVAAVLSENTAGNVEISFRSKPGFDVSEVALALGGGGHPQASGCTVPGPLAAAEARVVPLLVAAATPRNAR